MWGRGRRLLQPEPWREDSQPQVAARGGSSPLRTLRQVAALAIVYVVTGKVGLQLTAVSGFAAYVWPPTGISLAALLLGGFRLWPGIALGAFLVNWWMGAEPAVALAIAGGNTLEAAAGAYMLRRFVGFRNSLDRLRDVLGLVVLGAALSTMLSATIGVAALRSAGIVAPGHFEGTWLAWYTGDALGDLVFAPLVLSWYTARSTASPVRHRAARLVEAAMLGIALAVMSRLIFFGPTAFEEPFRRPYMLFPLLVWAAVRFEVRGAAAAAFLISVLAIWGTKVGLGPFVLPTMERSLFFLQTFMAIATMTALILAAVILERSHAEIVRRREEFVAMVSHDLKNPLTAIDMNACALEKRLSTDERGDGPRRQVLAIRRSAHRMGALIHDLLELASVEAGHLPIKCEQQDAGALLAEAIDMMRPLAAQKALTLSSVPLQEKLRVLCDRERILEVLSNLIGNAIKFTRDGGAVTLTARAHGRDARFCVTDNGPGIPPEQLSYVFDRFWQGKQKGLAGTGLGLAIAKGLVEAHGRGRKIRVESQIGSGSTFYFDLPRC